MKAFIFTGQGSQKEGMGKDLYDQFPKAKRVFEDANDILGERFSDDLFLASEETLMDTRFNQVGIFVYEVALASTQSEVVPDCVAGHSLGEYAALVISGAAPFEQVLRFLKFRGQVLYDAVQNHPSAMGAVIGVPDEIVLEVLNRVGDEVNEKLYVANYNGPGQIVITGDRGGVKKACKILKDLGAKRSMLLPMKASGHSPLAEKEGGILAKELQSINWTVPNIPVYQCVDGLPHTSPEEILENQKELITHPVQWTTLTHNMVKDGVTDFYEVGTDDTLEKIVHRMYPELHQQSLLDIPTYVGKVKNYKIIKEN